MRRRIGLAVISLAMVIAACGSDGSSGGGAAAASGAAGIGGSAGSGGSSGTGGSAGAAGGSAGATGGSGGAAWGGSSGAGGVAGTAGFSGQSGSGGGGFEPALEAAPGAQQITTLPKAAAKVTITPPGTPKRTIVVSRAGLDDPTDAHVYRVTRRDSSKDPGTLWHACQANSTVHNPGGPYHGEVKSGPRVVVFDVGGVLPMPADVEPKFQIRRPKTWIAGQTAPSPVYLKNTRIGVYASDIVVQHVITTHRRPGPVQYSSKSWEYSDAAGGAVASASSGQSVARVWFDHVLSLGSCDQAFSVWQLEQQTSLLDDVVFSHSVAGMPQARVTPNSGFDAWNDKDNHDAWTPYHEPRHAHGALTRVDTSAAFIEVGFIGMSARTPIISRVNTRTLVNIYDHDYMGYVAGEPVPVEIHYNLYNDPGDVSPDDRPKDQREVHLSVVGSYAEPGYWTHWFANETGKPVEILPTFLRVPDYGGPYYLFEDGNRLEKNPTVPIHDGHLVGPNGEPVLLTQSGSADRGRWPSTTPTVWSDYIPTHGDVIRARVLEKGGAWANERAQFIADYFTKTGQQKDRSFVAGQREKLWIEGTSDPNTGGVPLPAIAETTGSWSPPANPFAVASNGLMTQIEKALHDRSVAVGGARFGNLDRSLYVPGGGKLLVSSNGTVTWTGASQAHDPIEVKITYEDGSTETMSVATTAQ